MPLNESSGDSWELTGYNGPPSRQQILRRAFEKMDRDKRARLLEQQQRTMTTSEPSAERDDDLPVSPFERMRSEVCSEQAIRDRNAGT
jgi:hypothetical protein